MALPIGERDDAIAPVSVSRVSSVASDRATQDGVGRRRDASVLVGVAALAVAGGLVAVMWNEAVEYRAASGEGIAMAWSAVGTAVVAVSALVLVVLMTAKEAGSNSRWICAAILVAAASASTFAVHAAIHGQPRTGAARLPRLTEQTAATPGSPS